MASSSSYPACQRLVQVERTLVIGHTIFTIGHGLGNLASSLIASLKMLGRSDAKVKEDPRRCASLTCPVQLYTML